MAKLVDWPLKLIPLGELRKRTPACSATSENGSTGMRPLSPTARSPSAMITSGSLRPVSVRVFWFEVDARLT